MLNIEHNKQLQSLNTFQIPCVTDYFCVIQSIEEFQELTNTEIRKNNYSSTTLFFLGWWSNTLFTQEKYHWLVVYNQIIWKTRESETNDSVTITIGWGESRHDCVLRSIEQWYTGRENLSLIPWSVGAAPMQNIGAYGTEIKDSIVSITWIDLTTGTVTKLTHDQCQFGYRDSIFKRDLKWHFFITHVTFTLNKYSPETYQPNITYKWIQEKIDELFPWEKTTPNTLSQAIISIRQSKLPDRTQIGTAGSFFKNPIIPHTQFNELQKKFPKLKWRDADHWTKLAAGQLIELAWMRWLDNGTVGTYNNHALVLINKWWAIGYDVVHTAQLIQQKVFEKFGVTIEPEVNYVR